MNHLIHRNFFSILSPHFLRYSNSIAFAETHSSNTISSDNFIPTPLDPVEIFTQWVKSNKLTVQTTRLIHTHLIKGSILAWNIFIANSLIDWYSKSSAIEDAVKVFDEMPERGIVSWNIVISGLNENSRYWDSWEWFSRMRGMGFEPNEFTYGSVLSACNALGFGLGGELVYGLCIRSGFWFDGYIRTGMIDLFAWSLAFEDALRVFEDCAFDRNVVCWNSMISGAVKSSNSWIALGLFWRMLSESLFPNSFTFSSALTACVDLKELEVGKQVHGLAIKYGAREDIFVGTAIVDLYGRCGDIEGASKEFLRMPSRNVVSWTSFISAFVHADDPSTAFQFFADMRKLGMEVNNFTVTSIVTACIKSGSPRLSLQVHSWILKSGFSTDAAVRTSLINMYSKVGDVDACEKLFLRNRTTDDVGLYAVMVSAFAQNQSYGKATEMFCAMFHKGLKPEKFCTSSILSIVDCLKLGKQIHSYAQKTGLAADVSVGSSLLTMYSKCRSLDQSFQVFEQTPNKDVVTWASMISGFSEHDCADKAIHLFREMLSEEIGPDQVTLAGVLSSLSSLGILLKGKEVHGHAIRKGFSIEALLGGSLVNFYSKCGALESARRVFNMLPCKDHVSCSALVSGYAQNGHIEEAMLLFHEMRIAGIEIDSYIVSSVLGVVALLNKTSIGTQLHSLLMKFGLHLEGSVGSSLISMYSRYGTIDDCHKAFKQIATPDLIGWTTMIMSYAQNGRGAEALRLYEVMKEEGIKPDPVTFTGVLSACSHNGLVEEAYYHLNSMSQEYGIQPGHRHYACMVDVLCRAGRLKEAEKFIKSMPIKPVGLIWGTLLAACKVHGDVELGRLAAEKVSELDPSDAGAMVSLSNICADMGQWEDVLDIRSSVKGTRANKEPGWSSI